MNSYLVLNILLFLHSIPTLYKVIQSVITRKRQKRIKRDKKAALLTATAKLLYLANQNLNAVAKVNGLRLRVANVPKHIINTLNRIGDTVSYKTCSALMDCYASEMTELASHWTGCDVFHIGDNVDLRTKFRHETSSGSTKDLHFYNNLMAKSRVDSTNVSDIPPELPESFSVQQLQSLIPSEDDVSCIIEHLHSTCGC